VYRATFQPYCIGNSSLMKQSKPQAEVDVDAELMDYIPSELKRALNGETRPPYLLDPGMDRNKDGVITRDEWTMFANAPPIDVFEEFDLDKNNALSREEVEPGSGPRRLPPKMQIQEGLGFQARADGTFDRHGLVVAMTIDSGDVVHFNRCEIRSLVESAPPAKHK